MPAEVELKLGIAPGAAGRLLRHPVLAAARAGRGTRTRLVATYFDTPDGRLAAEGIGLRLRHERGAWLQTVKGPPLPASSGALVARDEHEFPLAGPELDRQALTRTPWSRPLQRALADPAFGPRFVTDFLRRTVPLRFADASTALLCIDCGELRDPDGEQQRSIAEIEIEQFTGAPLELFRFAALLAADLPLRILMAGKAERGHALLRGDPDGWRQPVRAAAPVLTADGDAASALAAIVRECAGQIAGNAAGLVHDDDPEWVHQMRVGTRRLRACLGLLQPLLPAPGVAAVAAELRWLAAALGRCRDLDVYVDELLAPLARAAGPDSTLAHALLPLQQAAASARADARAGARAAVDSPRFTRLVLAVGALGALPRFGVPEPASGDDPLGQPATAFAAQLLDRRHRRVRRRGAALAGGSAAERHALRIAAKKMRYGAEFFAPAFAHRKPARSFGASLAGLQDLLGQLNDGVTAQRLTGELAADRPDLAAAALGVAGWIAATAVALERDLGPAWKQFRRTPRFWRQR